MSVTMQNNIDIVGRMIRRNMDKSKLQSFARKVDHQWPVRIPIAISAHDGERRPDRLQIVGDRRLANVAEMPDLVGFDGEIKNRRREFVMRISENKDAQCIHFRTADDADNADIASASRKIIRLNPRNPRLVLPRVIQ